MCRKRYAEDVAELAIEIGHATLRMIDRSDDDVTKTTQPLGEQTQRDALAAARLASDHHEAPVADGEFYATAEGLHRGRHVQSLGGDLRTKRMKLQTEERKQLVIHGYLPRDDG